MNTDERREQLLRAGAELLGRRPHDQVSIEDIAAAAGVSKGLLYHYFPTKKAFILAALERGQAELYGRLRPDPDLAPAAQLDAGLDAFLDYVEEHPTAYEAIFSRGGGGDREVAAELERSRAEYVETLLAGLAAWRDAPIATKRTPALEAAIRGWTFFVEGAVLHQLETGGLERAKLLDLLRATLVAAVVAAAQG